MTQTTIGAASAAPALPPLDAPGTVARLRATGQLALVLDHIVGVPAGSDLAGDYRIPVRVIGDPSELEKFVTVGQLEHVSIGGAR